MSPVTEARAPRKRRETLDRDLPPASLDERLEKIWGTEAGLVAWLSTVDHKIIGKRYLITAIAFLFIGGLAALAMRLQLARPEQGLIGADLYNQLFTMHGTTMMFLFGVPIGEAAAVYLLPLMLGTRNIAFPRLNAFSYWVFLFGGAFLWISFFLNTGPDNGWFSYVPLSGPQYAPGKRADVWAQMITFTEVAALAVSVEIVVTLLKLRAPGMTPDRIPIFAWAMGATSLTVLFAMPSVMMASTFLILDRLIGTHFFNHAEGGHPLLWQHLFWFFGHPEVYIIFLPATGMVSMIIPAFVQRPIFGYTAIVLALIATALMSFGLWVHHMFATGLPQSASSLFTATSMAIAIPSGVQIFCWIATLWGRLTDYKTPILFVFAFIFTFVAGGLTGVMQAAVPLDLQVHDSYFVVAHFHYTLIGGAVFPLLGGAYFWYPKITGHVMSERLGRWHAVLAFVGFNLTFFPMHLLGLWGMTRRVYTYQSESGWGDLNLIASAGALLFFASFVVFLANLLWSRENGALAGDNPWGAGTLEWATTSPPPSYNFSYIPIVTHAEPLWALDGPSRVVGLRADMRQLLVTTAASAEPDLREVSPEPSIWPFLSALATAGAFIASIFSPWAVVWGAIPVGAALIGWFWPKDAPEDEA
jgi:cytochrome c oxidase subunit I